MNCKWFIAHTTLPTWLTGEINTLKLEQLEMQKGLCIFNELPWLPCQLRINDTYIVYQLSYIIIPSIYLVFDH